jgi:protein-S-isoprenylcysteine O-methyltransferase Ste14
MSDKGDHAAVRIPPPVLTLLHLSAAFLLGRFVPLPIPTSRWVAWLGILLSLLGFGISVAAVARFFSAGTTVEPHGSASALVTGGPYRFSRNPIYLGFVFFLIGFPLIFGNYWGILLTPALVLSMNRLVIRYEEAYLERKFGTAYLDFKARVRRWL